MSTRGETGTSRRAGSSTDEVGQVERRGVDYIPLDERNSSPWNVFAIFVGQACAPGIISLGWLPVAFGLGWWGAFTATAAGLLLGSIVLALVAIIGPHTGTNSAVSSGAFFGVRGRIIGSVLGFTGCLGFYALNVWAGGSTIVATSNRLFGTPDSAAFYALGYLIIVALTVVVAVYGHASMVAAQKRLVVPFGVVLIIVGFLVFMPEFDATYGGGEYTLGSFWATWALATATAASSAVTIAPLVNDWTRRISPARWSDRQSFLIIGVGCFFGNLFAMAFGIYTATLFTDVSTPYIDGFTVIAPLLYLVPFAVFIGFAGAIAHATLDVYSSGLDLSSLIPRLARVPATVVVSAIAVGLVFVGTFVFDLVDSLSALVVLLTVACMPWNVIMSAGHLSGKGNYDLAGLQAFNERRSGGAYWFWHGLHVPTALIWLVATLSGLVFADTGLYRGPLAGVFGGMDLGWVLAGALALLLYAPIAVRSRAANTVHTQAIASHEAGGVDHPPTRRSLDVHDD